MEEQSIALSGIDTGLIVAYFVLLIGKSFFLAKRAAKGSEAYFLGGRKMPWWALGASGMSSNLDAAGTITIISLIYLYGIHGFFIEMRGGVVLPIAVFLAFMGKWHQRSQVVTTGEWMSLRFGDDWQAKAARITAVATYLVITIGMVVFFLAAAGKFLSVFLPVDRTTCVIFMAMAALLYTMISGLYGVIWTDVFQAGLIGIAAVYIAVLASGYVNDELLSSWPGAQFNTAIPRITGGLTNNETLYSPFLLFLIFWAGKGILEGLGGSGGSAYMAQRFYAAKDVTTVKKLCLLWTILFSFRWPMVLGFAILAIHLNLGQEDPERILPGVLTSELIPTGVRGLLITAILAASMSTFDSTINAGASYVVRDLYLPMRPDSSEKKQVYVGYIASAAIVLSGVVLALLFAQGVVDVWVTIVIQLFPAFLIPFALRWFWSRFNGAGFTLGVLTGFAASFGLTLLPTPEALGFGSHFSPFIENGAFSDVSILGSVSLCSLIGCLIGTFAFPKTSEKTLETFYAQIRPFGLWPRKWRQNDRSEHGKDLLRLAIALIWQISTFLVPMLAVIHLWTEGFCVGLIWLVTFVWLLRDVRSTQP